MPNTTTQQARTAAADDVPSLPASVGQARAAWATAPRDAELDRWNVLYDVAVPAPPPQMTIWERYAAGWPARDADERARYAELDQLQLAGRGRTRGRPVTAPAPDDTRWTWGLVTQLLDTLEHAGYRRGDDTHVGQAPHLLHLAARIYAGETSPPSGPASRPQLSIGQSAAVSAARQAIVAFDSTGGTEGFLAVLGGAPERDRVARAFGIALADLRRVLSVVDDLTAGGGS